MRISHGFEIHFAKRIYLTKKERRNEVDAHSSSMVDEVGGINFEQARE